MIESEPSSRRSYWSRNGTAGRLRHASPSASRTWPVKNAAIAWNRSVARRTSGASAGSASVAVVFAKAPAKPWVNPAMLCRSGSSRSCQAGSPDQPCARSIRSSASSPRPSAHREDEAALPEVRDGVVAGRDAVLGGREQRLGLGEACRTTCARPRSTIAGRPAPSAIASSASRAPRSGSPARLAARAASSRRPAGIGAPASSRQRAMRSASSARRRRALLQRLGQPQAQRPRAQPRQRAPHRLAVERMREPHLAAGGGRGDGDHAERLRALDGVEAGQRGQVVERERLAQREQLDGLALGVAQARDAVGRQGRSATC